MKPLVVLFLLVFCSPSIFSATEKTLQDGDRAVFREDAKPSQKLQADHFSFSLPNEGGWTITKFFKPGASLPYRYFCERQTGRGDTGYGIDISVDGPPKGGTYKQFIETWAAYYKKRSIQPPWRHGDGLLEAEEIEKEPVLIKNSQGYLTLRTHGTSEFTKPHQFTEYYGFSQQHTETLGIRMRYTHVYYLGYRDPKVQEKAEKVFSTTRFTDGQRRLQDLHFDGGPTDPGQTAAEQPKRETNLKKPVAVGLAGVESEAPAPGKRFKDYARDSLSAIGISYDENQWDSSPLDDVRWTLDHLRIADCSIMIEPNYGGADLDLPPGLTVHRDTIRLGRASFERTFVKDGGRPSLIIYISKRFDPSLTLQVIPGKDPEACRKGAEDVIRSYDPVKHAQQDKMNAPVPGPQ